MQNFPVSLKFSTVVNVKSSGRFYQFFVAFSDYLNFKNDAINVILGLAFKTGSISMAIKLSRAILRVVGFGAVA